MRASLLLLVLVPALVAAVIVPGRGDVPASCVTEVPNDSLIIKNADGSHTVRTPSGAIVHYAPCKPMLGHGSAWKAWTQYFNSVPVGNFVGVWPVPPAPASVGAQTLFFWNGVEDSVNDEVLQPVLQFGTSAAGGGAYWAVASWYVSATRTFQTPLVKVNPGDSIVGTLVENNGTWIVTADGSHASHNATLRYQHPNTPAQTYSYCVLEAYTITSCNQYPAKTLSEPFTGLSITLQGQTKPVVPTWQALTQQPITCNEHALIASASSVSINWTE